MANKVLLGWCGHPVQYGTILCGSCKKEAQKRKLSRRNK